MSEYTLEMQIGGNTERLPLTAADDVAARRQALSAVSDVVRDAALNGAFVIRLTVALTDGRGALIYGASLTAS
ncbi:hypothetical protein [Brevundimonas sp.]|uniref:hypothetical protein n=1 Tax=Brevundimonas sp. TaxID=1871086 RepID=UPI0019BFD1D9|nr:hypothetical protein [Brevundimonas sp.]MBD3837878.1 hypothetical protein [Brevundimonas sp.]